MSKAVYVGNLPFKMSDDQLIDFFKSAGKVDVRRAKIILDRDTRQPRGFAFCEFADDESAASAIRNLNHVKLDGRRLYINWADERHPRPPGEKKYSAPTASTDRAQLTLATNSASPENGDHDHQNPVGQHPFASWPDYNQGGPSVTTNWNDVRTGDVSGDVCSKNVVTTNYLQVNLDSQAALLSTSIVSTSSIYLHSRTTIQSLKQSVSDLQTNVRVLQVATHTSLLTLAAFVVLSLFHRRN